MDLIVRACISLCLCHIILTNSAAVNQHLVCKSVQELFTDHVSPSRRHDGERREVGIQGQPGKRGALGPRGYPGVRGLKGETGKVDYNNVSRMIEEKVGEELESIAEELNELRQNITNPTVYKSCLEIRRYSSSATNGIYSITDKEGSQYRTYCDMEIGGGGWTLIASVHENYMAGKCTTGDRWSSEHGNSAAHPHGDGTWENTRTFGRADSATSDDYKNPGYYNMQAKNVMIWHVPNNVLMNGYSERAFMKYHTTSGFLSSYGGNLYKLFHDHYPLRDRTFQATSGNGPAPAIVWDKGDNATMIANTPPNMRRETDPGFIHFRAINRERGAFAICPGVKIKPGIGLNVEHSCIGGTSNHGETHNHCGDFSSMDYGGYGTGREWSSNLRMTESVVMIFYR